MLPNSIALLSFGLAGGTEEMSLARKQTWYEIETSVCGVHHCWSSNSVGMDASPRLVAMNST